jgi:formylglycine-generating enzyme required for sulfatase activity
MRIAVSFALSSLFLVSLAYGQSERDFKAGDSFKDCPNCPEMVVVPPGGFTMGSADSEPGHDASEGPKHQVTFQKPFAAGRFPVTFAEWEACVKGRGCGGYNADDAGWGRGDRPVINVSWNDAKAYTAWLSRQTGKSYRLLSESEREYVTRAGTLTPFWWGSAITPQQANYNGKYAYASGAQKGEYRAKTMPVPSFLPNPWGLYQVHGNIWEWVEDCWHENYKGAPVDGTAWTAGESCRRVLRGGSWDRIPQALGSAYRTSFSPSYRSNTIGFRVAKSEVRGLIALAPRPVPPTASARALAPAPAPALAQPGASVTLVSTPPPDEEEGFVDEWKLEDGVLILRGWGFWQPEKGARMMMNTNLPVQRVSLTVSSRPDVVTTMKNKWLENSGFEVKAYLDKSKPMPGINKVCVWTEDREFGSRRIHSWALCQSP